MKKKWRNFFHIFILGFHFLIVENRIVYGSDGVLLGWLRGRPKVSREDENDFPISIGQIRSSM